MSCVILREVRVAGITTLACLAAACLETPGAGLPDGGGAPDAGGRGTTAWQMPLGASTPYVAMANGELTIAASFVGTIELGGDIASAEGGGADVLVARLSAAREVRFVRVYGGAADEWTTAIAVSPVSGETGVIGLYGNGTANLGGDEMMAPAAGYHLFLADYDDAGDHRWSMPGLSGEGVGSTYALSMGGSGELALSSDFETSLTLDETTIGQPGDGRDLFYGRVLETGSVATLIAAGGVGTDIGAGAVFDGLGNLYLFGSTTAGFILGDRSPDGDADGNLFVLQIDDGATSVGWMIDSVGGSVGGLRGAVAPDHSLVLTGWFAGTFGFDLPDHEVLTSRGGSDVFIAFIRPDGTVAHLEQFGGEGDDEPAGVAVGPGGEVAITGSFHGDAGLGDSGPTLESKGGYDVAVASFDLDGTLRWARSFGGAEDDSGVSVAVDSGGEVVLGAAYRGVVDFGGEQPLDSGGETAGAVVGLR